MFNGVRPCRRLANVAVGTTGELEKVMKSQHSSAQSADLAVIGAGASGLAAAIFAAKQDRYRRLRIVALDGARQIGAKILISGGGRCNVT
ncbi:MAG: NAD(P)/FAD-dependent oxidoreductase, partial [Candidatus Sumerlaeaceae bacterium]|nr:NAD(P)/FAD-dependent oxidoreductase [Candidatus Sumerlaeaceae bacterium]